MATKFDLFPIVPMDSGMESNVKPFLIADGAYETLSNVYLWRSRLRKRFGSTLLNTTVAIAQQPLLSRFRIQVATLMGGTTGFLATPFATGNLGQMFSIGDQVFTVWQTVGSMLNTSTGTALFDTTTGIFDFVTIPQPDGTPVYWYPSLPAMGLPLWQTPQTQFKPLFGFDTKFSYQFIGGAWQQLGAAIWTGSNSDFFWPCSYRGITNAENLFFTTNNVDPIRYWDGMGWLNLTPNVNDYPDTLKTCKIIIQFQNRLVLLSTKINLAAGGIAVNTNQARWSAPFANPTDPLTFNASIPGQGSFIDCPTKEDIISARILRNRLIVQFETSHWELVFTNNDAQPFAWNSINIELGALSTFSSIPMDKYILGFGGQGILSCNGVNVERIDDKIPDQMITVENNNNGNYRVYGIRDFILELIYWSYPFQGTQSVYPNKVLVYNYKTGTWATNDDSITCFGYYQNQPDDIWKNDYGTWEDDDTTWESGFTQSNTTTIIAGNQQGFTFLINGEVNTNAPSLQITNIVSSVLTVIDHNLQTGDYVRVLNCAGVITLNGNIYSVVRKTADTLQFLAVDIPDGYTGQGTLSRVSRVDILTKEYNFYMKEARNAFIQKVDFLVDKTVAGECTVDTYISSAGGVSMLSQGAANGSLIGTGVLQTFPYNFDPLQPITLETNQDRFWRPVYLQADGECVQLRIYFSNTQMTNVDITSSDFQINAMIFYAYRTSTSFTNG